MPKMSTKTDTTTKPYKIIVVTNDKEFLKTLNNRFDKNYHFLHSQPVDNVIKKAGNLQPDLILKDISKRNNKNFQILKALKNDFRTHHIPVIIVTEKEKPGNIEEFFDAGASDNITKLFTPSETRLIIKTHLELKRKIDENKEMNLIKTKFFSIMTNDIKDILIGVKGIAGFLVKDLEDNSEKTSEVVKMARILYDDSKELYKFLENLIEWSSIETSQREIKPENIKFHDLLNNTIENFQSDISQKKTNIISKYDENIKLITDKMALSTVMFHLISNAIKYSHKNGNIIIRAEAINKSSNTRIIIEDNGIGMDKDVVKHIFQLDTPHPKTIGTNNEKGTGLGLIICRSVIEKILGKINIESKKHRGTKATVIIPELK